MIAGVSGQVLTEGDLEPEECVVKIASLLRYSIVSVHAGISIEKFWCICMHTLGCIGMCDSGGVSLTVFSALL